MSFSENNLPPCGGEAEANMSLNYTHTAHERQMNMHTIMVTFDNTN